MRIENIPTTYESISDQLQEIAGSKLLYSGSNFDDIQHIGKKQCPDIDIKEEWKEKIKEFDTQRVGPNVYEHVRQTYNSLVQNFNTAEKKLNSTGLTSIDIANACTLRLLDILEEVSQGNKRLTNGDVLCLSSVKNNKLHTKTIGYYEFACCNVSLDEVMVHGKSLREISDLCEDTDDNGDFLLPNSLGVSISLMAQDESGKPVFVGQFRNNNATLTQRNAKKVVSAASGSIEPGKDFTGMGSIELEEELGIKGASNTISGKVKSLMTGESVKKELPIGHLLTDELGVKDAEIEIGGIVFEEKRRNPELVLRASTTLTTQEIKKHWSTAEDKAESTGIRAISLEEIGDNLSGERDTLGRHFMQSLLAWYIS